MTSLAQIGQYYRCVSLRNDVITYTWDLVRTRSQHLLPPARHQSHLLIPSTQTINQEKTKNPEKKIILIHLPFWCMLKSRILSIIWTILFRFSFSGNSFLIIAFLKSINPSLILFTNCSFSTCLALIKSFAKNNGFWYFK